MGYALIEAYFNLGGAKSEAWFPEDEEWGLQGPLPSRDPGPARALGLPFGSRRLCPLWSGMRGSGVLAQMPAVSLLAVSPWTWGPLDPPRTAPREGKSGSLSRVPRQGLAGSVRVLPLPGHPGLG